MDVPYSLGLVLIAVTILVGLTSVIAHPTETVEGFATRAARSGMAEAALSRIAIECARDEDVRVLAFQIVTQQSMAAHELRRIAAVKGWRLPTNLDPLHRAMSRRLQKLSGSALDRAYLQVIVTEHDQTVEMFREFARTGGDRDLKDWVVRQLATLEDRQRLALATADGWSPATPLRSASTLGSRTAALPREA